MKQTTVMRNAFESIKVTQDVNPQMGILGKISKVLYRNTGEKESRGWSLDASPQTIKSLTKKKIINYIKELK
ncbi:MAG: hypothetical protein ACRDBG_25165 [Waterburya sp.]